MGSGEFNGKMVFLDLIVSSFMSTNLLHEHRGSIKRKHVATSMYALVYDAWGLSANNIQRQIQWKHYNPNSPVTEVLHKQWLDVSIA